MTGIRYRLGRRSFLIYSGKPSLVRKCLIRKVEVRSKSPLSS